jgi:hypothetical protein
MKIQLFIISGKQQKIVNKGRIILLNEYFRKKISPLITLNFYLRKLERAQ